MLQLSFGERRKTTSRQLLGLQTRGGDAEKEVTEDTLDYNGNGVLFQPHHSSRVLRVELRGRAAEQQQPQTHQVAVAGGSTMEPRVPVASPQHQQQTIGQLVRVPHVNTLPLHKMLIVVVTVVQQIMTEFNGTVLEKAKIVTITKTLLSRSKMATRVQRSLKITAFNVNGIWRQRSELGKQLQDLHRDVALSSETHLKPHEVLYSKLPLLSTRPPPGQKRLN
jgi:hypothetical protein